MTAGIRPNVSVIANGTDITASISARLSSLRLTDGTGYESDEVEIILADTEPTNPVRKPPVGAELQIYLGYDGAGTNLGTYVCDEVEIAGWPATMTIRCRSAIYAPTPGGKIGLQTQFTQIWKPGTTIGALVQTVAKRHGMEAAVSSSLASIQLPHIAQDAESDLNLLTRLAQQYDAVFKVAGGQLLFYLRGTGLAVSGQALPTIAVQARDVTDFSFCEQTRGTAGTIVAFYYDKAGAKKHVVSVGEGDPVKQIRYHFPDQAAALSAAKALLAQSARAQTQISFSLPGDPAYQAEAPLTISGFHPDIPESWVISQVEHSIDKDSGYICYIEALLPNDPVLAQYQTDDVAL